MSRNILVVDDDKDMCAVICEELERRSYVTIYTLSADDAFLRLMDGDYDAVVTDLNMHGMNGVELCERVVKNRPEIPVIVVTGFGSLETAIATMRAGALDFLTKPFDMEELALAIERALQHRELKQEVARLRRAVEGVKPFEEMIGTSSAMRSVFDLIDRVATTDATLLITGETGTGKELAARAIHERSTRASGPMVAINCSAMPENLLESELFGHVRGAFTDARHERKGLFLQADGGTLFLDEIGDMPLSSRPRCCGPWKPAA